MVCALHCKRAVNASNERAPVSQRQSKHPIFLAIATAQGNKCLLHLCGACNVARALLAMGLVQRPHLSLVGGHGQRQAQLHRVPVPPPPHLVVDGRQG